MALLSLTYSRPRMSSQASRSIRAWCSCQEPKRSRQLLALTVSLKGAKSTTRLVQDSPSGEPFSRLEMAAHPNFQSLRLRTPSLDTLLSAKRTVLLPSLSLRFSLTATTPLRYVLRSPRECLLPAFKPFTCTMFSSRVVSLSRTWLPQVPTAPPRFHRKRSLGTP